jgi:hypothetical protein
MKLNDSYLCIQTGCDEVFSLKEQNIPHIHYPICPACGNKNVLNLGRVLNRQGGKENEDPIKRIPDVGSIDVRHDSVDYAKQSSQPDERIRNLFKSNRPEDAGSRVSKDPSNLSGVCSTKGELGT